MGGGVDRGVEPRFESSDPDQLSPNPQGEVGGDALRGRDGPGEGSVGCRCFTAMPTEGYPDVVSL
jgi:hypothetical protein